MSMGGTILVFNTVGISTGLYYSKQTRDRKSIVRKLITFPPLIAFLIAFLINLTHLELPETLNLILQKLSAPFSILALLTIGMQMEFSIDKDFFKILSVGQIYKLFIAPFLIYILMWQILGLQNMISKICILGAAIGSMNAISIIASQMGLNPKLSAMMPAIGIPISIPILFLIDKFLL